MDKKSLKFNKGMAMIHYRCQDIFIKVVVPTVEYLNIINAYIRVKCF